MNPGFSALRFPERHRWPEAGLPRQLLCALLAGCLGILRGVTAQQTGGVVAWGNEPFGIPAVPEAARSNVVAIAAGTAHLMALRTEGTVLEWRIHQSEATVVGGLTNAVAIAAGRAHSVALRADGTVAAWGNDVFGQLRVPQGLGQLIAIAAAGDHTVALRSDGTVVAWGESQAVLPVPEAATDVKAIATGERWIQALRADGTLLVWDWLGNVSEPPSSVQEVMSFGSGLRLQATVDPQGRLYVWWDFWFDPLSLEGLDPSVPLAVRAMRLLGVRRDSSVVSFGMREGPSPGWGELPVPPGLSRVLAVASGDTYSMALVAEAAPVIAREPSDLSVPEFSRARFRVGVEDAAARIQWRHNGQPLPGATGTTLEIPVAWLGMHDGLYDVQVRVGAREVTSRSARLVVTPAPPGNLVAWSDDPTAAPLPAAIRSHVKAVALGGFGGVVLHHDGRVSSWPDAAPEGLGPVEAVAAGFEHRVAVERGGRVVVWGGVGQGQDQVPGDLTAVMAVSAGGFHTLALTRGGNVVAWGDNLAGQCDVPAGLTGVNAVAAGYRHSVALRDDGSVVQWGGTGFPASETPEPLGRIQAVAAGGFHTLALLRDGSVQAWGANGRRQSDVPLGLKAVVRIAAGADTSFALHADGRVTAWGAGWASAVPAGVWGVVDIAAAADAAVALIGTPRLELRPADTGYRLEWRSRGEPVVLQQRGRLENGAWQDVAIPLPAADGAVRVPVDLGASSRVYRLLRRVPEVPLPSP